MARIDNTQSFTGKDGKTAIAAGVVGTAIYTGKRAPYIEPHLVIRPLEPFVGGTSIVFSIETGNAVSGAEGAEAVVTKTALPP